MSRKTVEISKVKTLVNDIMIHTADEHSDRRIGAFIVLEQLLHDTGNYNGYGYLAQADMKQSKNGKSVGIHINYSDADTNLTYEEKFAGTDDSRRYYF